MSYHRDHRYFAEAMRTGHRDTERFMLPTDRDFVHRLFDITTMFARSEQNRSQTQLVHANRNRPRPNFFNKNPNHNRGGKNHNGGGGDRYVPGDNNRPGDDRGSSNPPPPPPRGRGSDPDPQANEQRSRDVFEAMLRQE
ncbi:hypothetical protein FRC07_007345, partial [Ceratobasidium sp. 392]